MRNIPDFIDQLLEIKRQFQVDTDMAKEEWRDGRQRQYYEKYVEPYLKTIEVYIEGGYDMTGMGLSDLLVFLDNKMDEMESLSGRSADIQFEYAVGLSHNGGLRDHYGNYIDVENLDKVKMRGGFVYDEHGQRDYWDINFNGPKPGEMSSEEMEAHLSKEIKLGGKQ